MKQKETEKILGIIIPKIFSQKNRSYY